MFEVPYEVPFIAVTEAAFTQLVNEQYAVLRRALAAHERLERVVLSERGLEALAGTLATLIGAAVLVFDARGEPLVQRAFRRTPGARRGGRPCRPSCASAARLGAGLPAVAPGARGPVAGAAGGRRGGARARPPSPAGERVPQAWLVAIKDGGGRCRTSTASRCTRRSRSSPWSCCADAWPATPSAGSPATCWRRWSAASSTGAELARRLEPFGLAERVAAIVVPRGRAGRARARRRGRGGAGPGPA